MLLVVSDLPSTVELLERLARLDEVLAARDALLVERDERIVVLARRVAELEALLGVRSTGTCHSGQKQALTN